MPLDDPMQARYELRNTPQPNERFMQSKQIQLVSEFGSKVYEEPMYRYWSSGDKLIFLSFGGYSPQISRDFSRPISPGTLVPFQ
jgi:hypothetical protein